MDYSGYYADDGLGGLGGDDGLGGLGGSYAPPPATYEAPDMFADDDGLMLGMPADEEQQQQQQQDEQQQQQQQPDGDEPGAGNEDDQELGDALDEALGLEPTQGTGSQLDSRSRAASDFDDDEGSEDEFLDGGDEDMAEPQAEEQQEPEDPAAAEAQRQNAWYKECFDAMTEAQRNRLEAYIRSNLQKKTMKKVLQELTGLTLNDKLVVAISSITKMFVGELTETARQIAAREGHSGALLPSHIRQAHAALSADGRVPHAGTKPLRLR